MTEYPSIETRPALEGPDSDFDALTGVAFSDKDNVENYTRPSIDNVNKAQELFQVVNLPKIPDSITIMRQGLTVVGNTLLDSNGNAGNWPRMIVPPQKGRTYLMVWADTFGVRFAQDQPYLTTTLAQPSTGTKATECILELENYEGAIWADAPNVAIANVAWRSLIKVPQSGVK